MAITGAPTAAEVLTASGNLRPEQVDLTLADSTALLAEITDIITQQSSYVETKLRQAATPQPWPFISDFLSVAYPGYTSTQITAVISQHNVDAALAVKYFSTSELFLRAGQLNERYLDRSNALMERGKDVLDNLIADFTWIVSQGTSTGDVPNAGVQMLTVNVGENFSTECY